MLYFFSSFVHFLMNFSWVVPAVLLPQLLLLHYRLRLVHLLNLYYVLPSHHILLLLFLLFPLFQPFDHLVVISYLLMFLSVFLALLFSLLYFLFYLLLLFLFLVRLSCQQNVLPLSIYLDP